MTFAKRSLFAVFGLMLVIMVSACGSTGSASPAQPTQAPAATPSPTPDSSVVKTAQATVAGQTQTILTDAKGMTLYYFTPDSPVKTNCLAKCAVAWPPLLFTGTGTPQVATSLPGTFSTIQSANGNQVEYAGYQLYTFIKDKQPGDVTGQGVGKVWYVATPTIGNNVVRVTEAAVNGKVEPILANAQGMTLYYYLPDTVSKTACTGKCAVAWPPLFSTGSSTPQADAPLTGTLKVLQDTNGSQIQYNGHFLYSFIKDKQPGDVTGQGVGKVWFVATPSLRVA